MNVEEFLTLYKQYKIRAALRPNFEGFMDWLENEYWLKKPRPILKKQSIKKRGSHDKA